MYIFFFYFIIIFATISSHQSLNFKNKQAKENFCICRQKNIKYWMKNITKTLPTR